MRSKPNTLFIDIEDVKRRLRPDTKAIIPVHYASQSIGLAELRAFALENKLRLIEDAAQAFGCMDEFGKVGSSGDIICFSFDGIKNITAGEGGCIVSSDNRLLQNARDIRLLGIQKDSDKRAIGQRSWDFEVKRQGYRYHMSNINAAIGLTQLSRIEEFAQKRRNIANRYVKLLESIPQVKVIYNDFNKIIPHLFVVKVCKRDELRQFLTDMGVETGIHYKPNHLLNFFESGYRLPATENIYTELLSLPCHVDLTSDNIDFVVNKIRNFYDYT